MDITAPIDSIVNNLVRDIETRLNNRVDTLVTKSLSDRLDSVDIDGKLNWLASAKLDNLISDMEVDNSTVQRRIDAVADTVVNGFETEARRLATEYVRTRLYNDMDVTKLVREIIADELTKRAATFAFPPRSIPGSAINPVGLDLTGNNITGGVIKNFNSVGIEDKSTQVQMTLLDQAVVIENDIVALGLTVKGDTVFEGNVTITGDIPKESKFYQTLLQNSVDGMKNAMTTQLFQGYSHVLFDLIRDRGLDLSTLKLNGVSIVDGNKLNYGINDTNISRLGIVKDLQTTGEALLSQTLYVTQNRVGINTIEPDHALSVWDQEVEIGFSKQGKDRAWFGTPRSQDLVIGVNREDNIVLKTDGSVDIKKMRVDEMEIGGSNEPPSHVAKAGSVMFNTRPVPGGVAGWISLGGGVWARFGNLG